THQYAKRIIQMGEKPENVFVVGAIGIDNIRNIKYMTPEELLDFTDIDFNKNIALMTYHPVTLDDYSMAKAQIEEILEAIIETDFFFLITMPNSDPAGKVIYNIIKDYKQRYPNKIALINNLGQKAYLSAMKYASFMIGNSSSGIIESASFKLPVVNIGDRQDGRLKPDNVLDCECKTENIINAIKRATSKKFLKSISNLFNPYNHENTSKKIVKTLESIDIKNNTNLIKKGFYDLP
ncbi:UDP-N-acetylglucosamine 2-epimerase, partial [Candidatus Magnetomorum sp. HK-1]